MRIVILDGYAENPGDLDWSPIAALGELTVYDRTPYQDSEIIRRIGDAEVVITNKTPITRKVLSACPAMKFVAVLATGYNIVDTAAAREYGVDVSNVPAYGTMAVSQYTIAMLLAITSRVALHSDAVHAGRWTNCPDFAFWDAPLMELDKKTIGIIGFGSIGQATGRIAAAMGMRVLAFSRTEREEGRKIADYVDLDTLLCESDVVSLHCPMTSETAGIINRDTIAKMKDGAILLNTARGQLVNEQDLADALNSGKLSAAAVDVVSREPIVANNPLLTARNCFITPHIAWAPKETRQRILDVTAENVRAYLAHAPKNVVNR